MHGCLFADLPGIRRQRFNDFCVRIKEVVVHGVCLRFRGLIYFVNREGRSTREQGDSSTVCCIPATG